MAIESQTHISNVILTGATTCIYRREVYGLRYQLKYQTMRSDQALMVGRKCLKIEDGLCVWHINNEEKHDEVYPPSKSRITSCK